MNKEKKSFQIIIALSTFLLFSAFSAFDLYQSCIETDFYLSEPALENLDQDYPLVNQWNKSFTIWQNNSFFILETHLFQHPPLFFPRFSPFDLKLSLLRC
jgi:hypothetical protein